MQTTEREVVISPTCSKYPHIRGTRYKNSFGSKQGNLKGAAPLTKPNNDFLTASFSPIPASKVGCGVIFSTEEIQKLSDNTPDYIIDSVNNYLKIIGVEQHLESTGNFDADYLLIEEVLSEHSINEYSFDFYKGLFSFCILDKYRDEFPTDELFYLPIKSVVDMCPQTAHLFKQFISYFAKSQSIEFPDTHCHFWDVNSDIEDEDLAKSIEFYNTGIAGQIFKEIKAMSVNPDILKADIIAYRKESNDEELLNLMLEGIDLFKTNSITSFSHTNVNEVYSLAFDTLFAIVWGDEDLMDDLMIGTAVDAANCDIGESEQIPMPVDRKFLSPSDKGIRDKDTYPILFNKWWSNIFKMLHNNE